MYAPVELPESLLERLAFSELPARYVDKIFAEIGHPFDLRLSVKGLDRSHLLAKPQVFEDLDHRIDGIVSPEMRYTTTHNIERNGRFDGFLVWLTLDTGAGKNIDILENRHCWLPVFFPAIDAGIAMQKGDRVEATCGAVLCEDGVHPDYFVEGQVVRSGHPPIVFQHRSPHHSTAFRSSPFYERFFHDGQIPLAAPSLQRQGGPGLDRVALMSRLRERLPAHMAPSKCIHLDRLPLTSSGKLDRRALLDLKDNTEESVSVKPSPATNLAEQTVVKIWRDVLKSEEIGLQTNFFDHGGHSLLLLNVQDRVKQEFGIDIPVTDLFKYPTVETLARRLGQDATQDSASKARQSKSRDRALARQSALAAKRRAKQAAH